MSATKTPEPQDKSPAAPVVAKQPESPEKAAGPQHAAPAATASPALPPNGAPSVMRAAEFVDQRGAGAAPRARTMMTLQRSVGNNRISNLVGTAIQTKLAVGAV